MTMRTPAELCPEANRVLRDWRFEPLPEGTIRLRQHPYGGLQPLSLLGAAVFVYLACTARNRVYPDANVLLIGMMSTFAAMLLWHGGTTVAYVAGDNFLEQHRFFLGVRWRVRRLLGATLQGVWVKVDEDRWRIRAVRKGVEIGSVVFGWSQFQAIGELLARTTGWKIELCLENGTPVEWPSTNRNLAFGPAVSSPVDADPESPADFKDRAVSTLGSRSDRTRRIRKRSGVHRKVPRDRVELCRRVNSALRDWRFEPLPDGTFRLRSHPYGGLQLPSLALAACFGAVGACLKLLLPNPVYEEGRWFLLTLLGTLGIALVFHGVSTLDYLAGDNFLEQRRFLCGICWRRRRLLGASLEGVRLPGATDRWRMRAVRKGVEIGSPVYGWLQAQPIGELLSHQTGWPLALYEQDENGKLLPYPEPLPHTPSWVRYKRVGLVRRRRKKS